MQKIDYPFIGETIYRDVLPNGLHVSVIPKPGYTRSFAMFATKYGGADRHFRLGDTFIDTPLGVAHFLEHKMFDMPSGDNALATLAANGAQPNAFTSSGMTAYHFESTVHFDTNLRTLLRFVSTPYFTEESVAKEQGIIGQEIRMGEDSPDFVIYEELMRALYSSHPVRESIAGTIESIAQITPETLYHCHQVFYNPGNMSLAVVGDVDPESVAAAALEILPSESGEIPVRDYGPEESLLPEKTRVQRSFEVSAPQFLMGAKLSACHSGDALFRQKLVSGIALNYLYGATSPFYSRLYADGLINTDFSADIDFTAETATVFAGGESREPEKVFDLICDEAEKAARDGLDPDYFRRVMRSGYGSRVRSLSSFAGLCSSLVDADFGGYNCLDAFSMTNSITAEEVRAFIRESFCRDRFAMSIINPLSGKEDVPADA